MRPRIGQVVVISRRGAARLCKIALRELSMNLIYVGSKSINGGELTPMFKHLF
jgi:hypothetical protein